MTEEFDPNFDPLDISGMEVGQTRGRNAAQRTARGLSSRLFELGAELNASMYRVDASKRVFLEVLARTGNLTAASTAAGWTRSEYQKHLAEPDFAAAFEEANEISTDALEAQARHLALQGVDEPIYYMGELVGYRTRYSERMLELLLKSKRRSQFGDKIEAVQHIKSTTEKMTAAQLEQLLRERGLPLDLLGKDLERPEGYAHDADVQEFKDSYNEAGAADGLGATNGDTHADTAE